MSHEVNIICCPDGLLRVGKQQPLPRHPGNFVKQAPAQCSEQRFSGFMLHSWPVGMSLHPPHKIFSHPSSAFPSQPKLGLSAAWTRCLLASSVGEEVWAELPEMGQAQLVTQVETSDLQLWETWCQVRKGRAEILAELKVLGLFSVPSGFKNPLWKQHCLR